MYMLVLGLKTYCFYSKICDFRRQNQKLVVFQYPIQLLKYTNAVIDLYCDSSKVKSGKCMGLNILFSQK